MKITIKFHTQPPTEHVKIMVRDLISAGAKSVTYSPLHMECDCGDIVTGDEPFADLVELLAEYEAYYR